MNKLFTKIAGVALGFSLAIGAGIGSKYIGRGFVESKALEVLADSLDLTTKEYKSKSYSSELAYGNWTIKYGANNDGGWNYFKMGGKSETISSANPAAIYSTVPSESVYSHVDVHGPAGSLSKTGMSVKSFSLFVYSDAALTTLVDSVEGNASAITKSEWSYSFTPSSGKTWAIGSYYSVTFNLANTSTSNGIVCVDTISCYKEVAEVGITSLEVANVNVTVGKTVAAEVTPLPVGASLPSDLTYEITDANPAGCATVSATGVVTGVKTGTATLVVKSASKSLEDTSTITVTGYTLSGIQVGKQYVLTNGTDQELTGFGATYGSATAYTGTPSCSYVLDVVEGVIENTVAFKTPNNTYLSWESGNSLIEASTVTENSSWLVNLVDEYEVINFASYGTGSERYLKYNGSATRFAAYTSGQSAVSFYEYTPKDLIDFTIDSEISLIKGSTKTITVSYSPADAADKTLTWSSDNASVATIDNGVVTAVEVGTTTIKASKTIGGSEVVRTCSVTVLDTQAKHLGTSEDPFTVEEGVAAAKGILLTNSNGDTIDIANNTYAVKGIITAAISRTTTTLSLWIGDELSQTNAANGGFELFKIGTVLGEKLSTRYTENATVIEEFEIGTTVIASGKIVFYNSTTPEFNSGSSVSYNSYITAKAFATSFNEAITNGVCKSDGSTDKEALGTAWALQETAYSALTAIEKSYFEEVVAGGKPTGTEIEHAVATYDHIMSVYFSKLPAITDFMNRVSKISNPSTSLQLTQGFNSELIVIVAICSASILFVGTFFLLKRKKEEK